MATRIVHLRLSEDAIVGCYDVLLKVGKSIENVPMSTAIRETLESSIRSWRQQGVLQKRSPEDIQKAIAELTSAGIDFDPVFDESLLRASMDRSILEDADSPISDIAERVERTIQETSTPDVDMGLLINEGPISEVPVKASVSIKTMNPKYTIQDIKVLAPKDNVVETINESTPPWLVRVIEIVYSGMSVTEWGTVQAINQIESLKNKYQKGEITY